MYTPSTQMSLNISSYVYINESNLPYVYTPKYVNESKYTICTHKWVTSEESPQTYHAHFPIQDHEITMSQIYYMYTHQNTWTSLNIPYVHTNESHLKNRLRSDVSSCRFQITKHHMGWLCLAGSLKL